MSTFLPSSVFVLPKPTLFWVDNASGYENGLYLSPNTVTLPEYRKSRGHSGTKYPDPWQYFYARTIRDSITPTYWAALCPTKLVFDSFLSSLNDIPLELYHYKDKDYWRLSLAAQAEWKKAEQLLRRLAPLINKENWYMFEVSLDSKTLPWPSHYGYDGLFASRDDASYHLKKVRAVFMLKVVQLKYMHFLNPRGGSKEALWLEKAQNQNDLTLEELGDIRRSSICSDEIVIERVGMIFDMRIPIQEQLQKEVMRLLQVYSLPVWLYFGPTPGTPPRPLHYWYNSYLPPRHIVEQRLMRQPSKKGIRTYITMPSTTTSLSQPTLTTSSTDTSDTNLTSDSVILRPDPLTGQLPGQSRDEFWRIRETEIARRYAHAPPDLVAQWNSLMKKYKDLQCPTRDAKVQVFEWVNDMEDIQVRRIVKPHHWQDVFQASAQSQRRYDPVHNEFDIGRDGDLSIIDSQIDPSSEQSDVFTNPDEPSYSAHSPLTTSDATISSTSQSFSVSSFRRQDRRSASPLSRNSGHSSIHLSPRPRSPPQQQAQTSNSFTYQRRGDRSASGEGSSEGTTIGSFLLHYCFHRLNYYSSWIAVIVLKVLRIHIF